MASRWVDGFIVMDMAADLLDMLALAHGGKEVVLCVWNQEPRTQRLPLVDIDFRLAGELATRHLLECGHRRIATIVEEPVQRTRRQGFEIALAESGLKRSPGVCPPGQFVLRERISGGIGAPGAAPTADCHLCGQRLDGPGRHRGHYQQRFDVPRDLAVVGVDDISQAAHAHPPLTTISIPKMELARTATELLLRRIRGTDGPEEPTRILPALISSCASRRPASDRGVAS